MSLAACTTAAFAAAAVLAGAGAAATLPKLYGNPAGGGKEALVVRPVEIGYTGDGSGVLGGFDGSGRLGHFGTIHWSSWTAAAAAGSGAVWLDDCEPDCAGGTFHPVRVSLRASAPAHGYFTRLTLRYTYQGKQYVDRRGLHLLSGYFEYFIVG